MRVKSTKEISNADRGALSIIIGFVIPLCYAIVSDKLAALIHHDAVTRLLRFPITWPSRVYYYFNPPDPEFTMFQGLEDGNIFSVIIGNWVLYALLTYAFLYWRAGRLKLP